MSAKAQQAQQGKTYQFKLVLLGIHTPTHTYSLTHTHKLTSYWKQTDEELLTLFLYY